MIWIVTNTILGDKAGSAYDLVPLDGDMEKVGLLDRSIDIGIWPIKNVDFFRCGRRIGAESLPARLPAKYDRGVGNARKGGITLPDFIGVQPGQIVSDRFRALFKAHDTGQHQFEPVSIVWSKPKTEPQTYFLIAMPWLTDYAIAGSESRASCPPVVEYIAADQARAAYEVEALPEGGVIVWMRSEYVMLRDRARACGKA